MVEAVAIIPVYNEQAILPHCLAHLKQNGIQSIIVLDNESTDNSAEVALNNGATVISFSSNGEFCEETITKWVRNTIAELPAKYNWILKVDADEFYYSSKSNETLFQFIERIHLNGYNCIGSFSHQVYPLSDEIHLLYQHFDPVNSLKNVIPHIKNGKYSAKDHLYYKCIWKVNIFQRSLRYKNPHFVEGHMLLAKDLLLLKHTPYTLPDISFKRLIYERKKRLSKRNFEIGLSTHYHELPDDSKFVFDHLKSRCFNWDTLYNAYLENFDATVIKVLKRLDK